jgi:hypothetical protein
MTDPDLRNWTGVTGLREDGGKLIDGGLQYLPKFDFDPDTKSYLMAGPSQSTVTQDLILSFHRDVEGKIRKALIDLGWTPPK